MTHHGKRVLLKLSLKMPGGTCEERTQAVLPKNLQLTSEYQASKASEVPDTEPGQATSSKHDDKEKYIILNLLLINAYFSF